MKSWRLGARLVPACPSLKPYTNANKADRSSLGNILPSQTLGTVNAHMVLVKERWEPQAASAAPWARRALTKKSTEPRHLAPVWALAGGSQ
jgi:hypothetical protein